MSDNAYDPDRYTGEWLDPDAAAQQIDDNTDAGYEQMIETLMSKLGAAQRLEREANGRAEAYAKMCDRFRAIMLEQARRLSLIGSHDHKMKNEALLGIVATLMTEAMLSGRARDDDSIPF